MKLKAVVPNWTEDLCKHLFQLHTSHVLCDVLIDVKNSAKLLVHSNVLAAGSPVLKKMFQNQMKGKELMQISTEYDLEVWLSVIRFLYTGQIEVSGHLLTSLQNLASYLCMHPLVFALARLENGTTGAMRRSGPTVDQDTHLNSVESDSQTLTTTCTDDLVRQSTEKADLIMKTNRRSSSTSVQCPRCKLYFKCLASLRQHHTTCCSHGRMQEVKNSFLCPTCGVLFSKKSSLDGHLKLHAAGKVPDPSVNKKKNTSSGGTTNTCTVCSKSFQNRTVLERHKVTHTSEASFHCDRCSVGFKYKSSLTDHQRKRVCHAELRQDPEFACRYCEKKYSEKKNLTSHVNVIHLGLSKFVCSVCGKTCGKRYNLERHMCRKHGNDENKRGRRNNQGSTGKVNGKNPPLSRSRSSKMKKVSGKNPELSQPLGTGGKASEAAVVTSSVLQGLPKAGLEEASTCEVFSIHSVKVEASSFLGEGKKSSASNSLLQTIVSVEQSRSTGSSKDPEANKYSQNQGCSSSAQKPGVVVTKPRGKPCFPRCLEVQDRFVGQGDEGTVSDTQDDQGQGQSICETPRDRAQQPCNLEESRPDQGDGHHHRGSLIVPKTCEAQQEEAGSVLKPRPSEGSQVNSILDSRPNDLLHLGEAKDTQRHVLDLGGAAERMDQSGVVDQSSDISMWNAPDVTSDDSYVLSRLDYSLLNLST